MPRSKLLLPVTLPVLLLAACATPNIDGQAPNLARQQITDTPAAWINAIDQSGEVQKGWIAKLGDDQLTKLVIEAQQHNRSLRVASAGVERSWLLAKQAGSALKPQANIVGSGSVLGFGDDRSFETGRIGVQAQWEVDVWGRIRSGVLAAEQNARAQEADFQFAQMSLAASVARAYYLVTEAEQQRLVAQDIVEALDETLKLVLIRKEYGLATAQDVSLTRARLASAKDTVQTIELAKGDALRALEVLIGRYPSSEAIVAESLPAVPAAPPAGLPSSLLERRPDLIAAERRIAAAIATVNQDKAARLPSVRLTGGVGASSSDLLSLVSPSNILWSAATNLIAPIFDGGRRKTQVEISNVDQQAAVDGYAQAALTAFQEVESSLEAGQILKQRRSLVTEASDASDDALRLARIQYDLGEIDLLSVLQLQQEAFVAKSNVIAVHRLQLQQFIDLNLALGGDWT